ncbi:MAG: 16S rRNA (adenine(1518)-N(6)/adenine(1519)-N(6))-dimethyltransferase RsmA [Alphaproteobacteria bacterium]|nr:16S rRNA (adenine(1518)-N(6)/adenine(1519)-N(6))-dimethyltransferase RsmA [Alphaproteobacteria bacterium]
MSADDRLPPLREVIASLGLSARKSLGQNFLLDLNLTRRIARAAGPLEGRTVVEIGPGPGGLTRALLSEGAAHVIAIERDERCRPGLDQIADAYDGRLTIVEADALDVNEAALIPAGARALVVANLPYNIATPLLIKWLTAEPWPPWFESLTLMFQREVAERLCAKPRTKSYGRLSVITQWRTDPKILFDVNPGAFTPPPKVISTVVRLDPLVEARGKADIRSVERVTAAAFGQRRKMLRSSLKALHVDVAKLLERAAISETARAEEIDVEGFGRLARAYEEMQGG